MIKALYALKSASKEVTELLSSLDVDVHRAKGKLLKQIAGKSFNVIITDKGLDVISEIKDADPRAEIFLVGENEDDAIEALNLGASAFFTFPIDTERLRSTIEDIIDVFNLRRKTAELEGQLYKKYVFAGCVVSKNNRMLDIFTFIRRIAPYYQTVLITGETGTGKEVISKALHICSVPNEPFVVCNCASLTENLLASELFGHKKGAFTGAISDKKGLFEMAGKGNLFLDEIGELPTSFQAHFLRVLQDGQYRPVGSEKDFTAKCRIITATNRNLEDMVKEGSFREDLYYRLTPLTIHMPPLRERKEDIQLLVRIFLEKFNSRSEKKIRGISRPAQSVLMEYDWPGNVRELENVIDQAAIMTQNTFIGAEDLPSYLSSFSKSASTLSRSPLDEVVRAHIEGILLQCSGNRSKAAIELGISRRALIRKIEKHNIA